MKTISKKVFLSAVLVALLAGPVMAAPTFTWQGKTFTAAGQVILSETTGGTTGGPFEIVSGSGPVQIGLTVWCLESQIEFVAGNEYWYTIDDKAYSGGNGAAGDPISNVTDYIYRKFLAGGYSQSQYAQIRNAIWAAEDEVGPSIVGNTVYEEALNAVGGTLVEGNMWTNALNLWTLQEVNGQWVATDVQSHTYVPAPGAILLAGMGTCVVGWLRRRQSL